VSRLLLDANVSPALAEALCWRGHDAVHVNELGLRAAPDATIFQQAVELGRAVVTHDDDYLRLLRGGASAPSVIHLRQRDLQRDPLVGRLAQAVALGEVLREVGDRLERGVAVRVGTTRLHVDTLPLSRRDRGREPPASSTLGSPAGPAPRRPSSPTTARFRAGREPPARGQARQRELPGPGARGR
jgi:predicted nuclease of predicted toxin-antitoxin system